MRSHGLYTSHVLNHTDLVVGSHSAVGSPQSDGTHPRKAPARSSTPATAPTPSTGQRQWSFNKRTGTATFAAPEEPARPPLLPQPLLLGPPPQGHGSLHRSVTPKGALRLHTQFPMSTPVGSVKRKAGKLARLDHSPGMITATATADPDDAPDFVIRRVSTATSPSDHTAPGPSGSALALALVEPAHSPPIIDEVRAYLRSELRFVREEDHTGRLAVHRAALAELVEGLPLVGPLLREIRTAYDDRLVELEELARAGMQGDPSVTYEKEKYLRLQAESLEEVARGRVQRDALRKKIVDAEQARMDATTNVAKELTELRDMRTSLGERNMLNNAAIRDLEETLGTYSATNRELTDRLNRFHKDHQEATGAMQRKITELTLALDKEQLSHKETRLEMRRQTARASEERERLLQSHVDPATHTALQTHAQKLQESVRALERKLGWVTEEAKVREHYEPPVEWAAMSPYIRHLRERHPSASLQEMVELLAGQVLRARASEAAFTARWPHLLGLHMLIDPRDFSLLPRLHAGQGPPHRPPAIATKAHRSRGAGAAEEGIPTLVALPEGCQFDLSLRTLDDVFTAVGVSKQTPATWLDGRDDSHEAPVLALPVDVARDLCIGAFIALASEGAGSVAAAVECVLQRFHASTRLAGVPATYDYMYVDLVRGLLVAWHALAPADSFICAMLCALCGVGGVEAVDGASHRPMPGFPVLRTYAAAYLATLRVVIGRLLKAQQERAMDLTLAPLAPPVAFTNTEGGPSSTTTFIPTGLPAGAVVDVLRADTLVKTPAQWAKITAALWRDVRAQAALHCDVYAALLKLIRYEMPPALARLGTVPAPPSLDAHRSLLQPCDMAGCPLAGRPSAFAAELHAQFWADIVTMQDCVERSLLVAAEREASASMTIERCIAAVTAASDATVSSAFAPSAVSVDAALMLCSERIAAAKAHPSALAAAGHVEPLVSVASALISTPASDVPWRLGDTHARRVVYTAVAASPALQHAVANERVASLAVPFAVQAVPRQAVFEDYIEAALPRSVLLPIALPGAAVKVAALPAADLEALMVPCRDGVGATVAVRLSAVLVRSLATSTTLLWCQKGTHGTGDSRRLFHTALLNERAWRAVRTSLADYTAALAPQGGVPGGGVPWRVLAAAMDAGASRSVSALHGHLAAVAAPIPVHTLIAAVTCHVPLVCGVRHPDAPSTPAADAAQTTRVALASPRGLPSHPTSDDEDGLPNPFPRPPSTASSPTLGSARYP